MYGIDRVHTMQYYNLFSRHTLDGQIYSIEENEQLRNKAYRHNMRVAGEYHFNENSSIDLAYTGKYMPDIQENAQTTGNFQTSDIDGRREAQMHNIALHFRSGFGLDAGGDYTHYTTDNRRWMHAEYADGNQNRFTLTGGQRIDRYNVYADQKHKLHQGWNLGYGISYTQTHNHDFQTYTEVEGDIATPSTDSKLKEQTTDFYISLGKDYPGGISWSVSGTGEYYSIGNYRKWAFYPQASLTYMKTPEHILQLSLSTRKTYPGYWEMQSSVSYINGYSEIWGTPGLRPQTNYSVNANYILKQKYVFGAYFSRTQDQFMQTAYQSTERLAMIYKMMNWNYTQYVGLMATVPFQVGTWWDSRWVAVEQYARHRCDDFFDLPFDRKKWILQCQWDNTFKLNKNLAFELRGFMQTPAIQGTYDLKMVGTVDAGVKWTFAGGKATLSARCSDIFNTSMPECNLRYGGQDVRMENSFYLRTFTLNFNFRFGGYKKKEIKEVDTSRFRH